MFVVHPSPTHLISSHQQPSPNMEHDGTQALWSPAVPAVHRSVCINRISRRFRGTLAALPFFLILTSELAVEGRTSAGLSKGLKDENHETNKHFNRVSCTMINWLVVSSIFSCLLLMGLWFVIPKWLGQGVEPPASFRLWKKQHHVHIIFARTAVASGGWPNNSTENPNQPLEPICYQLPEQVAVKTMAERAVWWWIPPTKSRPVENLKWSHSNGKMEAMIGATNVWHCLLFWLKFIQLLGRKLLCFTIPIQPSFRNWHGVSWNTSWKLAPASGRWTKDLPCGEILVLIYVDHCWSVSLCWSILNFQQPNDGTSIPMVT